MSVHHVAVTVTDFEKSLRFYEKLGFTILEQHDIPQKHKRIALMSMGNLKLEVFCYESMRDDPSTRATIGNNVNDIGMKHFALSVDSLAGIRKELIDKGIEPASEIAQGDCNYDFFFIRDPDGIWIEYVEDHVHN